MFIEQLTLKNYRNYSHLQISFENNINVIKGENAQGKTNLLESIYVLAFTKSYRTQKDRELILWNEPFATVKGMVRKQNDRTIPLELIIHQNGKKAKVNKLEQQKLSNYIGTLNVVMFAPEDLALVKGAPQIRRRFLDMELGQVDPLYLYELSKYQKILKQRNFLLKKIQQDNETDTTFLDVLTEQLVSLAASIVEKRFSFIKLLRKWAHPLHYTISQERENLSIDYSSSVEVLEDDEKEKIEQQYVDAFMKVRDSELKRGTTLIGPHRDDLELFINDKDVKLFGSQGQQRTAALSLKLAGIDLIYEQINEYPILLLDDVLSELDDFRQSLLLSAIRNKVQTFVTTTTVDGIHHETLNEATIYTVENGNVLT